MKNLINETYYHITVSYLGNFWRAFVFMDTSEYIYDSESETLSADSDDSAMDALRNLANVIEEWESKYKD